MTITFRDITSELGLKVENQGQDRIDYFCPVHDNQTGDLSVYPGQGFGCHGDGGKKPISLLMHCKDMNHTDEAVKWLKQHFPDDFENIDEEKISKRNQAQEVLEFAVNLFQDTLRKQEEDLREQIKQKRDFTDEDIDQYRIGFFSYEDSETLKQRFDKEELVNSGLFKESDGELFSHLTGRIIYPYLLDSKPMFAVGRRDYRKEEDLWEESSQEQNEDEVKEILDNSEKDVERFEEARAKWLDGKLPKYKKTWNTAFNEHVLYELRNHDSDSLVVTEGAADAISAHKSGLNVVSPITTRFSRKDVDKIVSKAESFETVYLVNDGDEKGQEGAADTAQELVRNGVEPYMVRLEDGDDLDDYTTDNGYSLDDLFEESDTYLEEIIKDAETKAEIGRLKRKVFELTVEWSKIDRNLVYKDLPGSKREIKKEFKEWKKKHYEPQEEDNQDLEIEDPIKEDNSVTSNLKVGDVEIQLNPVSDVRVHGLMKTQSDLKSDENGAIKPERKFKVYTFSFGHGAEEDEYKLFTDPKTSINPGDKYLAFRRADLDNYESYFREKYNKAQPEISFNEFKKLFRGKCFELAGELSDESKEKVRDMDNQQIRELVESFLDNGFNYDHKIRQLMYPRIVIEDSRKVDPQDIMSYQPHAMFFTNTKVGKSYISERVGERRDDITPAGLVGYVSADDGRKSGILHKQEEPVFADEINFGSKEQLNDELLTLLELGEVTQSKAGEDLRTEFYGSLTYMANPTTDKDNVELVEKFLRLIEGLGNNVQAMGSRFGVILFDQELETVSGTAIDSDKRKKLSVLVDWIKSEVAESYSELENDCRDWLSKEFPQGYKNRINGSKSHVYSSKINDFWEAHKESFRHARGQALRMAVYRNHLADMMTGDYDKKEILEDAEDTFMDLLEINLDSIIQMNSKLNDEERVVQRSKAIIESQRPMYLKLFVKTCIAHKDRKEDWDSYDPFTVLQDTWQDIKEDLDELSEGDRYYKWNKIAKQISNNRIRKQDELSERYGLHLTSEQDVDMVKIGDTDTFTPFEKACDFEMNSGDKRDKRDIGSSDENENVCVSDEENEEKESNEGTRTHTSEENEENSMSQMSPMSPKDKSDQPTRTHTSEENEENSMSQMSPMSPEGDSDLIFSESEDSQESEDEFVSMEDAEVKNQ